MLKYLFAIAFAMCGYCADVKPESKWMEHQYVRVGTGVFAKKHMQHMSCAQLGLGSRFARGEHAFDISTDILIHPNYQAMSGAVAYHYAQTVLQGVYFGPGVKFGNFMRHEPGWVFTQRIIQVPGILGFSSVNDKGRLTFIEAQMGVDKFLTVSSGFGF